ncbi:hypothetical protein [Paenibacillus bouchesdurhonensis]|uniref:hypothetical protein n=1 Tax=Paenibacillus bouchesdurhonensis TaxID=1870990 RepID=UPI000DA62477|nr:hypothetical protein [Paenibacillus bouchesdurhonensis]
MKRTLLAVFIFVLIFSLPVQAVDYEIVKIDGSVSKDDAYELKAIMLTLDPEDRENVLVIKPDGSFLANKREIRDEFIKQNSGKFEENGRLKTRHIKSSEEINESYVTATVEDSKIYNYGLGEEFTTMAYTNPSLNCLNTVSSANSTGPFRRVESQKGFTRFESNIYLPSKADSDVFIADNTTIATSNDKAYIYTGGNAYSSNGQFVAGVDLGLALNYPAGSSPSNETWGMYASGGVIEDPTQLGNFKMGQTVFMKYYISADNYHALNVQGQAKNGTPITRTVVMITSGNYFTEANKANITVRRVTSIAQTRNREATGSFVKNVNWTNSKVGVTPTGMNLMNSSNTWYQCGYGLSNVSVDYVNQANEKVWINTNTLPK